VVPWTAPEPKDDGSDDSDDHEIQRLVMVRYNLCMLCGQSDENCEQLSVGMHSGWIFCPKCGENGRMQCAATKHINSTGMIPMSWIFGSTLFQEDDHIKLKFFRHSRKDTNHPIFISDVRYGDNPNGHELIYNDHRDMYVMYLTFFDDKVNDSMGRSVSLQNLFAHNPGLYEELTTSDNLYGHYSIKVRYSDISTDIKLKIEHANQLSKETQEFEL